MQFWIDHDVCYVCASEGASYCECIFVVYKEDRGRGAVSVYDIHMSQGVATGNWLKSVPVQAAANNFARYL